MFVIRSATVNDLDELYAISKLLTLINLPSNKEKLKSKINDSIKSFNTPSKDLEKNSYIFVLEDTLSRAVIGVSTVHGKHGTTKDPHFFLKVSREHKLSTSLNTGFIHGTLKFGMTTDGYSEIGGLIILPNFRGHPQKLGKALSFSRFLYIGEHPTQFTEEIHSELLPPFDHDGKSPLWEAIGRRFLNMDYHDADKLSRENKEFITSLYPIDTIYEVLLPILARNSIGKVGKETEPVKKMLESIGFRYTEEVDPFDGGPHYRCQKNEITVIKNLHDYILEQSDDILESNDTYLISFNHPNHDFYAVALKGKVIGDRLQVKINDESLLKLDNRVKAFHM